MLTTIFFSAPVDIGPRANPASYAMGIRSFSVVKRLERGVDQPTQSISTPSVVLQGES